MCTAGAQELTPAQMLEAAVLGGLTSNHIEHGKGEQAHQLR